MSTFNLDKERSARFSNVVDFRSGKIHKAFIKKKLNKEKSEEELEHTQWCIDVFNQNFDRIQYDFDQDPLRQAYVLAHKIRRDTQCETVYQKCILCLAIYAKALYSDKELKNVRHIAHSIKDQ
tara:strand:- start:11239 stop:11607 length:369 start_codon:yes stop_codon:yes gene_type:complete